MIYLKSKVLYYKKSYEIHKLLESVLLPVNGHSTVILIHFISV